MAKDDTKEEQQQPLLDASDASAAVAAPTSQIVADLCEYPLI
jgi:hypothetical protein